MEELRGSRSLVASEDTGTLTLKAWLVCGDCARSAAQLTEYRPCPSTVARPYAIRAGPLCSDLLTAQVSFYVEGNNG